MTIEELETYFNGIDLPDRINLEVGVVIDDVKLFLDSHISYVKNNGQLKSAEVFMLRLEKLHSYIENEK